jgi:hypothetical protein
MELDVHEQESKWADRIKEINQFAIGTNHIVRVWQGLRAKK